MPSTFNYSDVMISYSRKDKIFIRQLDQALRQAGREVWIDWEDIPPTADWWKEIQAGIEAANTVVFVITPDSVLSSVCKEELEHAVKHNKRIIPLLLRDIADSQVKAQMHPALQQHNWIMFREEDDFNTALSTLVKSLETDLAYVGIHTKLLVRAREWEANKRKNGFLLRGDDLREAERWLAKGLSQDPIPTALQAEYIQASRKSATRFRQVAAGAMLVALVLLSFLTARVFAESQNTQVALETANSALLLAEQRDQSRATAAANAIEQADLHATAAQDALDQNATAQIAQGMAQHEADNAATQAQAAQYNAATATVARGQAQIEAGNARQQASIAQQRATESAGNANLAGTSAADANANATQSQSNAFAAQTQQAIAIANANAAETQQAIAIAKGKEAAENAKRTQALQLADSSSQALAAGDRQLALTLALSAYSLDKTSDRVQSALLAANYAPGLARRFEVPSSLRGESGTVAFSNEGRQAQLAAQNGTVLAWDVQTGAPLTPISNVVSQNPRLANLESKVSQKIITLTVSLNGKPIEYQLNHAGNVTAQGYSSDGKLFISGDDAGLIYLWDVVTGVELYRFTGHTGRIVSLAFNSTKSSLISYASDGTVRIWDITALSATVDNRDDGNNGDRAFFALSPDGIYGLSWDYSGGVNGRKDNFPTDRIILWYFGKSHALWDNFSYENPYTFAAFSPDSKFIVYANENQIFIHRISENDSVEDTSSDPVLDRKCNMSDVPTVAFSSDSKLIVVAECKQVLLYNIENADFNNLVSSYTAQSNVNQVYFSQDNKNVFLVLEDGKLLQQDVSNFSQDSITDPQNIIPTIPMITLSTTEVISGETSGRVRLWNGTNNSTIRTYLGHTQPITDVAISDDKIWLAAIASDNKIIIWQYQTAQIIFSLTVNESLSNLRFAKINNQLRLYGFSSSKGVQSRLFYWVIPNMAVGDEALDTLAANLCGQGVFNLTNTQVQQLNLSNQQSDVCNQSGEGRDASESTAELFAAPEALMVGNRIEAESSIVKQNGSWEVRDDAAASGGQYLVNTTADSSSTLSLVFEGTGIDVLYAHSSALGIFTAQVDGGAMQSPSRTGTDFIQRIMFDGLPDGQHTLTIIPLASQIGIDGFVVRSAPTPETTPEATPELTPEIVAQAAVQVVAPPDNFGWSGDANWILTEQGWFVSVGGEFNILTLNDPVNMADNQPRQLQLQSLLSVADIGGSIATIQASTDNQNWTLLHTVLPTDTWQNETVDLSAFNGQSVYLRLIWFFVPGLEGQDSDFWMVDDLAVSVHSPTATIPPTLVSSATATLTLEPTLTQLPTNMPEPTLTLEIATPTLFVEIPIPTEVPPISFSSPVALPVIDNLNSGAPDWTANGGWELDEISSGDLGWYALGTDAVLTWRKPVDLSATQKPLLTFDSLLTAQAASATVQLSSDGFTWIPAFSVTPQGIYQNTIIDLSPYVGQTVYIRFVWQSQNESAAFWFIDNIRVEDTELTAIPSEPLVTEAVIESISVTEEMPVATVTETIEALFTETSLPAQETIIETATADQNSGVSPETSP